VCLHTGRSGTSLGMLRTVVPVVDRQKHHRMKGLITTDLFKRRIYSVATNMMSTNIEVQRHLVIVRFCWVFAILKEEMLSPFGQFKILFL
jgi:hypothetical protein